MTSNASASSFRSLKVGGRLSDPLISLVLGIASFALYLVTCAPSVLFGDPGELQFVPYILGIAHPTGYPLYVLLGWAWSHLLPLGDPAYRMNLFSALWAALAVSLAYLVALRVVRLAVPGLPASAVRLAAFLTAVTLAVGTAFWSQAVVAEVYSFNTFWVALILLLLLRAADTSFSRGRTLALSVAYGLSLTHHRTMLLWLPGMVFFVWLTRRDRRAAVLGNDQTGDGAPAAAFPRQPRAGAVRPLTAGLVLVAGLVAPLLLYLYLPLRAPAVPYASLKLSDTQALTLYANTGRGFVDHLSGSRFASYLAAFADQSAAAIDWGGRLAMGWELLRDQFSLVGIGLALVGVGRLAHDRRGAFLALTGISCALGVAFNLAYLIGDVRDLFTPAYLVVSLWAGVGMASLAQLPMAARAFGWLPRAWRDVEPVSCAILVLLAMVPVTLLATHWREVDQSANVAAAAMWRPILSLPIAERAVLVSNDRDEMMPLWYYQYVERQRPDLLGLFPQIVGGPQYANVGGLLEQVLLSQRPVYLIKPMPGLEVKAQLAPSEPLAPLVQVRGLALVPTPVHTRQVTLADTMRLVGYDQVPANMQPGGTVTVTLYWQPQQEIKGDYSSFVHILDDTGESIVQSDHVPGGVYYPSSLWRPGEVLVDSHQLKVPADAALGVYRLWVGMHRVASIETLGSPIQAGWLALKDPGQTVVIPPDNIQRPLSVQFGKEIALLGHDWQLEGQELHLTLYWRALRPMNQDWTVFIHMLNQTGAMVAQQDSQPRQGRYPTSVWDEEEVVDDPELLELPGGLADGNYQVIVGLYATETGERLHASDAAGNPPAEGVSLLKLVCTRGEWKVR